MDFWLYRICLGVILFIIEMFLMTFDFLAIGIAAMITGALTYVFGIDISDWKIAGGIFLLASIIAVLVTRLLVLPKIKGDDGPEPMSGEAVVGKILKVEEVNKRRVVRYEGVYWNIDADNAIKAGDSVVVLGMKDNHLQVEKK